MKDWTTFNINDDVRIRLTERGRTAVNTHFNGLRWPKKAGVPHGWRVEDEKDGYLVVQFWDLMSVLGGFLYTGAQALVENNEVSFPAHD